ncbi:UNVERIFIED_CONTAM: hypothetical protein FKN15_024699 [Acipenser sinensis]
MFPVRHVNSLSCIAGHISSKAVCRYHDVFEHLNISVDNSLLKFTRPVNDWRRPTVVYMDLTLYSILAVIWQNEFISWDPSEFCGISKILVPKELMWIPDISIYEFSTDGTTFPDLPYLTIDNNGKVEMFYSRRVVSTCNINVHQFPFDTQNCNLTSGSELHSSKLFVHLYLLYCPEILYVIALYSIKL